MRVNTATRLGRRLQARGEFVIGSNRRRLKQAGVRFRPRLANAQGHTARFADDTSLDIAVVVWATGYRSDYSWISIPGVTANGHVVHRRGVTDVPGLYFLGLSWQYTRGSSLTHRGRQAVVGRPRPGGECGALGRHVMNRAMMIMTRFTISGYGRHR